MRHEHAQTVGEVLEQEEGVGGRAEADIAELIRYGQGLMLMEWTLGLILSCQEAMGSSDWGMMTLGSLCGRMSVGGPIRAWWHGRGKQTDRARAPANH